MTQYAVCTTFNKSGYDVYGRRMIQGFLANWPKEITLYVYAEDCLVEEVGDNLIVRDCATDLPDLMAFKNKWGNVPKAIGLLTNDPVRNNRPDKGKNFKWDAVRFSHKVYSIFHCAKTTDADVLFWMDADTICHSPITLDTIVELCPDKYDLCYLGRTGKFSECGLYSMNLKSDLVKEFLKEFQRMYDDADNGIFKLAEWHDSFVFDAVRLRMPLLRNRNWSKGLIKGEGHPLINSAWGAYLDHLKGARKQTGKSHQKDLLVPRTETYWKTK